MGKINALHDEVRTAVAGLDPDAVPLPEVTALWETFDAIERLASGAKTLLARRVDEAGAWKQRGYRSAAEALAATAGTSVSAARGQLETSERVASLPETAAALRAGSLSAPKAEAIAAAAMVDPASEGRLLSSAVRSPLRDVRDACLRAKVAADGEAMHERIRHERRLRDYCDAEGAWNLAARGTPEAGAEVKATLDGIVDELFRAARADGTREAREAYGFDALVTMARRARGADRASQATAAKPLALLRVDVEALRRGTVDGDEVCEITGIGPIPVRVARDLLGDATIKLVITKGTDVVNVTHLGRGPTAAQRAALLWESPTCRVEAAQEPGSRSTTASAGPAPDAPDSTSSTRSAPTTTTSRPTTTGPSPKAPDGDPSSHPPTQPTPATGPHPTDEP